MKPLHLPTRLIRRVQYTCISNLRLPVSTIEYIGVYRVGLVAALHPPLVSHPPFNFAPGCTNGPKDWVQKNGLNISSSKRHSPFIYVYPLKSANKSSLPPGSGCKKGWVRKKIFEVGPKKEEREKVGAVRFRTRVRKKFFGRFAPAPTFEKSCVRPCESSVLEYE